MEGFHISINLHFVFSTKGQQPILTGNVKEQLWAFFGDIAREHRIKPLAVGGTADHVHLFMSMPTIYSVAEAVRFFKNESSAWVRESFPAYKTFAWQEGDLVFGQGEADIPATIRYIRQQEERHRKQTFQQEYIALLEENNIEYKMEGLWD